MEGGPPCFPRNFTCFVVLRILPQISGFRIQGYYLLRLTFPDHSANHPFFLEVLYPDSEESVWAVPFSLAATGGIAFAFFSSGYLDVSVPRVPFHTLWIGVWIHEVYSCGFPHSDISGSRDICSSPRLFAAYHVFRRLSVPRHPPCALSCLTFRSHIM